MSIEILIEKYSKLLYKICFNMLNNADDAQEALQEVYINIYKNLNRYSNLEDNDLKNILCKITLNKCKDILKSKIYKTYQVTDTDITVLENYSDENDIESEIYKKERKLYIVRAINELKNPYNEILYEYYIDEKTLEEISENRNVSKGTLKIQIHRGKSLLKEKLMISGGDSFL
ncbi:MAG: sigma-70 family RNA polymerase sigma factor [Clostridia bacterium]|nr:sigma-70 family RNA polymerase sigma factor [Clostridia bacterium]